MFTEHEQAPRTGQPHDARQQGRDPAGHKESQRHLGEESASRLAHDDEVAIQHPFQSTTHRPAVDSADDGDTAQHDASRHLLQRLDVGLGRLPAARLVGVFMKVVPRAEGPPSSGEDNDAHGRVAIGFGQSRYEILDEFNRDGIQSLRTIQRHNADRSAVLGQHGAHIDTPHSCGRMTRRVLPSVRGRPPKSSTCTRADTRRSARAAISIRAAIGAASSWEVRDRSTSSGR